MHVIKKDYIEYKDHELLRMSLVYPDIFEIIVDRYLKKFTVRARSVLKDEALADEVVQDVFVKIYTGASLFEKREGIQFASWAYTILNNHMYTVLNKRKIDAVRGVTLSHDDIENHGTHDRGFSELESKDLVKHYMSRVPKAVKEILTDFFLDELSFREIAEKNETTEGAIRTRLSRAKQYVKLVINQ